MKIADTAHTGRPWRIHDIAVGFRVEDVWQLPTPGGPDDFPRLVQQMAAGDPINSFPRAARGLFSLRWKLGARFGWDDPEDGIGSRVQTLRDRLPSDLRDAPAGPVFSALPFTSVFLTDTEWAAEMANKTVHTVMHLSWVADDSGGYHGQLAVLVKPNGAFGKAYMAAIAPFRYVFVYPALMRLLERGWPKALASPIA